MNSASLQTPASNRLVDQLSGVLIIAYKESTEQLEAAFRQEGLPCQVLRQDDNPDYQTYSSSYRTMLNHCQGWLKAAEATKPTLLVEADFVPVSGLGQLPLPFDQQQQDVGICWLYTCAPQIYSVNDDGFAEGFSTGLVAYILTPQGARTLVGLVDEETQATGTGYTVFDSHIDTFLRRHSLKNYIPFRNYGEHGGVSNPEHRKHGFSGIHRADVLFGKLAFLPAYATTEKSHTLAFLKARSQARIKGIGRLLLGKFLRPYVAKRSSVPLRLISFAVQRQISFWL